MTPEEAACIRAGDIVLCDGARYRVVSIRTGAAWGPYFRLSPLDEASEGPHRRWMLTSHRLCEVPGTSQRESREVGPR